MANHWVCKSDGAIQCQEMMPISLDTMRTLLASIVGDANIIAQAKKHVIVPTMCGIPAGSLNAYELTAAGYYILVHGFVGRMGFADCPATAAAVEPGAGEGPIDYATVLAATKATSVGTHPVLVRELIGRAVRVYEEGSIITKDFVTDRTNIVTKGGRIVDIWFG